MKRWFHKEDGGLMVERTEYAPTRETYVKSYTCSVCHYVVFSRGEHFNVELLHCHCAPFSDLPEDLQAAALEEML